MESFYLYLNYIRIVASIFLVGIAFSCTDQKDADHWKSAISKPQKADRSGGVYRIPLGHNPVTLDPAYVQDRYGTTVLYQLFDRLVQFGPYLEIMPALAESWRIEEEGRSFRFFLRPNVLFHHGRTVNADDVVFSLQRLLRVDPAPAILPNLLKIKGAQAFRDRRTGHVEGLQALNSHAVLIRLQEPHMPLLAALGAYQASIVPEEVVGRNPEEFGRQPLGTGPFRFVSWQANQSICLQKFPAYYAGASFLDRVEFQIYPGAPEEKVLADFRMGKLEEMSVTMMAYRQLCGSQGYQWMHQAALRLFFYGMNCKHPNLQNSGLRGALFQSIDREKMGHEIWLDRFAVCHSILPPELSAYTQTSSRSKGQAPDPVKTELAEPGHTSNWSKATGSVRVLEMVSSIQNATVTAEMQFISRSFKKLGIVLQVKYITDWAEFKKYIKSDQVQLYRFDWKPDMPDPDNVLYPLFGSDSPNNYNRYSNPEVDRMLVQARSMQDPSERAALYKRIEKRIMRDMPIIPLFHMGRERVFQPYVNGVYSSGLRSKLYLQLERIWLSENPLQADQFRVESD